MTDTSLDGHLRRYLALRRALGYQLVEQDRLLRDFVDYMDRAGQTRVSTQTALAWAASASSDRADAVRLMAVRGFARWLVGFEDGTEVPARDLIRAAYCRRTPYVFAAGEVAALMQAASTLPPPWWAATMTTLIGLLASSGIRPGEAYRLGRAHVDLASGQLSVMHSKYGKSRRIPLHSSTVDALAEYARRRDHRFPGQERGGFFLNAEGKGLTSSAVTVAFRRLVTETIAPGGLRPRLGDLRHSFAVSVLLAWHGDGDDVQRRLPVLSAYLGHQGPRATYWYLQAVPELMALAANRLADSWEVRS